MGLPWRFDCDHCWIGYWITPWCLLLRYQNNLCGRLVHGPWSVYFLLSSPTLRPSQTFPPWSKLIYNPKSTEFTVVIADDYLGESVKVQYRGQKYYWLQWPWLLWSQKSDQIGNVPQIPNDWSAWHRRQRSQDYLRNWLHWSFDCTVK